MPASARLRKTVRLMDFQCWASENRQMVSAARHHSMRATKRALVAAWGGVISWDFRAPGLALSTCLTVGTCLIHGNGRRPQKNRDTD